MQIFYRASFAPDSLVSMYKSAPTIAQVVACKGQQVSQARVAISTFEYVTTYSNVNVSRTVFRETSPSYADSGLRFGKVREALWIFMQSEGRNIVFFRRRKSRGRRSRNKKIFQPRFAKHTRRYNPWHLRAGTPATVMRAYVRAMRACCITRIYTCSLLADLIPQSRKIRRDSKKLEGGGQE